MAEIGPAARLLPGRGRGSNDGWKQVPPSLTVLSNANPETSAHRTPIPQQLARKENPQQFASTVGLVALDLPTDAAACTATASSHTEIKSST